MALGQLLGAPEVQEAAGGDPDLVRYLRDFVSVPVPVPVRMVRMASALLVPAWTALTTASWPEAVPFAVPLSAAVAVPLSAAFAVPLAMTLPGVGRVPVVLAECSLVLVMPVVKRSAVG